MILVENQQWNHEDVEIAYELNHFRNSLLYELLVYLGRKSRCEEPAITQQSESPWSNQRRTFYE